MKGFIALLSVIIVSIILLGLALSSSTIAFYARFNVLDQESYAEAQSLARSCASTALLQLTQNYNYTATDLSVSYGLEQCTINSITTLSASSTQKEVQIETSANYHNSFATYVTVTTVAH
jgi:hypothetical protein